MKLSIWAEMQIRIVRVCVCVCLSVQSYLGQFRVYGAELLYVCPAGVKGMVGALKKFRNSAGWRYYEGIYVDV